MTEFWEQTFKDKQDMWGWEPAESTVLTKHFFVKNGVKSILIPGIGYGRNAQIFRDSGISVKGIEISQTAIDIAKNHFGNDLIIYHGSVTEMPFDNNLYDGIFCYALVHLLNKDEREKLIQNCYNQLTQNGFMVFATITKSAEIYGQGTLISKDRFEVFAGIKCSFTTKNQFKKNLVKLDCLRF